MKAAAKLRSIDSKYNVDVNGRLYSIQDLETIPDDEPIFLLRARDRLALLALHSYLENCRRDSCTTGQIQGVEKMLDKFRTFAYSNPSRMKQPGISMCTHDRLSEDGICRGCGADRRGL